MVAIFMNCQESDSASPIRNRAYLEFSGEVEILTDNKILFQTPNSGNNLQELTSFGNSEFEFLKPHIRREDSEKASRLFQIAQEQRTELNALLTETDEMWIFLNSNGGELLAESNTAPIAVKMQMEEKPLHICTNFAGSTAAEVILRNRRALLHCLPESILIWHCGSVITERCDPEELEKVLNMQSLNNLMSFLFARLKRNEDITSLAQAIIDLGLLVGVSTMEDFKMFLKEYASINFDAVDSILACNIDLNVDDDYRIRGSTLHEIHNLTEMYDSTESMAQMFEGYTGNKVTIGDMSTPWSRFFSFMRATELARERGVSDVLFVEAEEGEIRCGTQEGLSDDEAKICKAIKHEVFLVS